MNSLHGIKYLTKDECVTIFETAMDIKTKFLSGKRDFTDLLNKNFLILFFEDSTRTKVSFQLAISNLGGKSIDISVKNSSLQKGETILDTLKTLEVMRSDGIITRSSFSGFTEYLSKNLQTKVVNAGDGINEHPTQALLDHFTILERFEKLEGLTLAIIGDISHSRVARSNIFLAKKFNINVKVFGPNTLVPSNIERIGAKRCFTMKETLQDASVIMILRLQLERQKKALFPSLSEFYRYYGLNDDLLDLANKDAIILHPGPSNRGVEASRSVLDSENCLKDLQVENGVFIRMAILKLMFS